MRSAPRNVVETPSRLRARGEIASFLDPRPDAVRRRRRHARLSERGGGLLCGRGRHPRYRRWGDGGDRGRPRARAASRRCRPRRGVSLGCGGGRGDPAGLLRRCGPVRARGRSRGCHRGIVGRQRPQPCLGTVDIGGRGGRGGWRRLRGHPHGLPRPLLSACSAALPLRNRLCHLQRFREGIDVRACEPLRPVVVNEARSEKSFLFVAAANRAPVASQPRGHFAASHDAVVRRKTTPSAPTLWCCGGCHCSSR
jgi:hypothetical protein